MASLNTKSKLSLKYGLQGTNLFKPIRVGNMNLQHRVVFAPCTRSRSDKNCTLNSTAATYYSQRSQRPGTFLVSEATLIDERAGGNYKPPGIYKEDHYQPWRDVFDAVHENESYIFHQLWAIGGLANPRRITKAGYPYVGPSDDVYINEEQKIAAQKAGVKSHGLTKDEIEEYSELFARAAKKSVELGADGVEIHGANGYLPTQFFYKSINKRTDEYGGTVDGRTKFFLEIVDAVSDAIGPERVGVRISPFVSYDDIKLHPYEPDTTATYAHFLAELEERRIQGKGIAYVHTVEPRSNPEAEENGIFRGADFVLNAWSGTLIRSSDYGSQYVKTAADVQTNDRTLISYGRYFISNPDLPDRLENDWPLNDYDRSTFYGGGAEGYLDYPFYDPVNHL